MNAPSFVRLQRRTAADTHAHEPRVLKVGGYTPFSATDYPGLLSAVVFVQGCPWQCGYCHNPHLRTRTRASPIPWATVLATLERRVGLLDAVVFCGGEATMDPQLGEAIMQVRALGFKIGLETAGMYPDRLRAVLPGLDWVGLDIKAPFANYESVTGVAGGGARVQESLVALMASGIDHECRTTVHPALLPPDTLVEMARTLAALGVRHYALQEFRPEGCQDQALLDSAMAGYPGADIEARIAPLFRRFEIRRH